MTDRHQAMLRRGTDRINRRLTLNRVSSIAEWRLVGFNPEEARQLVVLHRSDVAALIAFIELANADFWAE
jgi:hypothetical protein